MATVLSSAANLHTCALYCVYFYQSPKTFPLFFFFFCRKPKLSLQKVPVLLAGLHPSRKMSEHARTQQSVIVAVNVPVVAHTWKENTQIWGIPVMVCCVTSHSESRRLSHPQY